jgi:hypothetical protein
MTASDRKIEATTAGVPRETSHSDLAGGLDIDVTVTLPDGGTLSVSTTLHPARNGPGTDFTLWIPDEATLRRFQAMRKRLRRQVEDAIEFAARAKGKR